MLFDNSYQNLPQDFFERINPVPVKDPQLIIFNNDLGRSLGIDQKINSLGKKSHKKARDLAGFS